MGILAIVAALAGVFWLWQREAAGEALRDWLVAAGYQRGGRWGRAACWGRLGLFAIGAALAAAAVWRLERSGAEPAGTVARPVVLVVLDLSASMRATAGGATRLQRAVEACRNVAAALPEADFGLVTFGGEAWLDYPPSPDRRGWQAALAYAETAEADGQGSHPGAAMTLARQVLAPWRAHPRVVLLCSDGEINVPPAVSPDPAWRERDFPCVLQLPGAEGETAAVPMAGVAAETRIADAALRARLEQTDWPFLIRPQAEARALPGAITRLLREDGRRSAAMPEVRAARLMLLAGALALLLFLATQRWRGIWLLLLLLLPPLAGRSERGDDLYRQAYRLCRQAEADHALWPAAYAAARAAVQAAPGSPEAAILLEYMVRLEPAAKEAAEPDGAEDAAPASPAEADASSAEGGRASASAGAPVPAAADLGVASSPAGHPWRRLEGRGQKVRKARPACHPW